MDRYEKSSHVGPARYEDILAALIKSTNAKDEYEQFLKILKATDCATMDNWLQVYTVADVLSLIKSFRKGAEQYYPDEIVVCIDVVSVSAILMTYVLNKCFEKDKKVELGVLHVHQNKGEELMSCTCNGTLKISGYCEECQ